MPAGDFMQQREKRFEVIFDKTSLMWTIVDTHHPSFKGLDETDDIPEESQTHISDPAFMELAAAADKEGLLGYVTGGNDERVEELEELNQELKTKVLQSESDLKIALVRAEAAEATAKGIPYVAPMSESAQLKKHVADNMLKLVAMDETASIGKG